MRIALLVVGILLLIAGLWAVFGNGSYTETNTVLQVGSAKLSESHHRAIPEWLGISGIVVGALLVLGGVFSKR